MSTTNRAYGALAKRTWKPKATTTSLSRFPCKNKVACHHFEKLLYYALRSVGYRSRKKKLRTTAYLPKDRQSGLRAKRDFRVEPCNPTKSNVTIFHFILPVNPPPERTSRCITYFVNTLGSGHRWARGGGVRGVLPRLNFFMTPL